MTCLTASDLSLLEILEQELRADVSVSLLAKLERELLRLRCELSRQGWGVFCSDFYKRSIFSILQLGNLTLRRVSGPQFALPADVLDAVLADSSRSHHSVALSPAQLISAWEYSLPASRSVLARKDYFSREIAEVIRTAVKPRILLLGAGQMREAADALYGAHLQHVEFVAVEPDSSMAEILRHRYIQAQLQVEERNWDSLGHFAAKCGSFDLIYSVSWLDATDDAQAASWLLAAVEMLRPGGRILAANFTPDSRDAGWMEACWNWRPFYRSEQHLAQLVMDLKHPQVRGHAVCRDESGASAYIEIHSI